MTFGTHRRYAGLHAKKKINRKKKCVANGFIGSPRCLVRARLATKTQITRRVDNVCAAFLPSSSLIRSMTPMYKCLRSAISLTLTLWCARAKGPRAKERPTQDPGPSPAKNNKTKGAPSLPIFNQAPAAVTAAAVRALPVKPAHKKRKEETHVPVPPPPPRCCPRGFRHQRGLRRASERGQRVIHLYLTYAFEHIYTK